MTTFNQSQLVTIDPLNLRQLHDRSSIFLVDVREPGEYAGEHIAGAMLVPLSDFDTTQLEHLLDRPVVVYCQSGNRSSQAAQKLLAAGFSDISHLEGGLATWKAAGYATNKQPNAPISLFRQIQIVAGSLVVIGTILGAFVSPWFLLLSGFVGCGLVFAGITNTCALGMLLAKLPYNRREVGS
jgi:rhodanese-related sulfurtransferase